MWMKVRIMVDGKSRLAREVFDELNDNLDYKYKNFSTHVTRPHNIGREWTEEELKEWLDNRIVNRTHSRDKLSVVTRKVEALKSPGINFWVDNTNLWPVVKHEG